MMGDWGVLVRMHLVPNEDKILELRQQFTEIAEEFDAEYNGWETEIVPK
jgi:hypothetical protein